MMNVHLHLLHVDCHQNRPLKSAPRGHAGADTSLLRGSATVQRLRAVLLGGSTDVLGMSSKNGQPRGKEGT